jgi:hypothetical protein
VLLALTLAKDSTKQEILQALQLQDANENHLVSALLSLIAFSEYAAEFYNRQFEPVNQLFHEETANYTPTVKTVLGATTAKQFASRSFALDRFCYCRRVYASTIVNNSE